MSDHAVRVREWNSTETAYPRDAVVQGLFAEMARSRSDAVALSPEDGEDITYGELMGMVGRLAGVLVERGVRPGDRVAVGLERSVEGYVAILGILWAGGVYVPLDLNFPSSRLEVVLEDSGCRIGVSSMRGRPQVRGMEWVDVDRVALDQAAPEPVMVSAEDPAYVMYTSGSTGAPKGVVIPHRGIVRFVRNTWFVGFAAEDVVCGTVNLTFDLSIFDLFGALLNGSRLVVPKKETLLSAAALHELLLREKVSVLWLGAALFHQFTAQKPDMFASLRCLVAGGDALNPTAVRQVLQHGKPTQFLDGYGPTENSVLCTAHLIEELPVEAEAVPIGRPLSNCTAYVVRPEGSLADVGEEGELWVGGDGVAIGYLNQPELTAERFVPDPFSGRGRLYRTGDMARWRGDGVIEFLGRRDRQTKLGGFRVELREIEIVLAAHPDVAEAVVAVQETPEGERRLRGWVVAEGQNLRTLPMRLRSYLRDRLPVFMVPAEIGVVDVMPVNASGKVDRAALLARSVQEVEIPAQDRPREGMEQMVAEIWQQVLGVGQVSRSDDFFALGGQSLQATQVVAAISGRLGLPAEHGSHLIRSLLGNPTVATFADRIQGVTTGTSTNTRMGREAFLTEAALPVSLRFDAPAAGDPLHPRRVLLTGATGFQGVFLIDRLITAGVEEVWCLVRAQDADHARRRLAGRIRRYGLDYEQLREHIVPVPGDVSKPLLGLGEAVFDELSSMVDTIVHSGSLINFAYPYTTLRQTNVTGVHTLLDLATRHRLKPFHHISTMIALVGAGTANERYLMEDTPLDFPERVSLGYAESKWVAEQLVVHASRQGLPVAIYRPYEITGTRDRGIWNTDTLMCAWFRTIAETGLAPDVALPLDFVPVDYTAEAIVHIMHNEQPDGRVYNLTNPADARLELLVERLQVMGYPVRKIPYSEWVAHVTDLTRHNPQHPMTAFMPMFNDNAASADITVKEMYFAETFPEFSRANTIAATKDAGLDLPPVDAKMIDLYLRYFIESGFLTPPDGVRPVSPDIPRQRQALPLINGGHYPGDVKDPESVRQLIKELQPHVAGHIRTNSALSLAGAGSFGMPQLRRLIAGELIANPAEIDSFNRLARRFSRSSAGSLFADIADALHAARSGLEAAANALNDPQATDLEGARTFAEFITATSHTAGPGTAAIMLRNDLMLWCAVCAELLHTLRTSSEPAPQPVLDYLTAYSSAPAALLTRAADVAQRAVLDGEAPELLLSAALRTDHVLHAYWRTVAG